VAKITPITEHFQHFLADLKESFWGDVYGQTKLAWQRFLELESQRQRDRFSGWGRYERARSQRRDYRNGYYERDFVTRLGTLRQRVARTRGKSFLPRGIERFQRRAEEVAMLIREAFLRGISTRQVGRVVATVTEEVVSAHCRLRRRRIRLRILISIMSVRHLVVRRQRKVWPGSCKIP
jgi:putative transposase